MARRRTPNRETAHRMFCAGQSDPTRKATYKYAKKLEASGDLLGAIAVRSIVENFGVVHKGVKLVKAPRVKAGNYLKHAKSQKNNALAGYIIHRYETFMATGMGSLEAYERAVFAPDLKEAVDSGAVGHWATNAAKAMKVVETDGTKRRLKKDGPRKAQRRTDRANWREAGNAHRDKLAEIRATGKAKGLIEANVREALRKAGVKNV